MSQTAIPALRQPETLRSSRLPQSPPLAVDQYCRRSSANWMRTDAFKLQLMCKCHPKMKTVALSPGATTNRGISRSTENFV